MIDLMCRMVMAGKEKEKHQELQAKYD